MKVPSLVVVCLLVVGGTSAAQSQRVRPLDAVTREAYERGLQQSQVFRALVTEVEASDLIVHAITTRDLPTHLAGATRFVAHQGTTRYLRIELSAALSAKARASVLAHELQHAVEIATSAASSSGGVLAYYRAFGRQAPTLPGGWETAAAEAVERRVWSELGRTSRRTHTVER